MYHSPTVPQPMVEVTSLTSAPFYAGSALTLRCAIEVDSAVDIPYSITVTWLKSRSVISSSDHTTISDVTQLSPHRHEATLTLNPLRSGLDTGTYTCQVTVNPESPSPSVQGSSQVDTETITVQGTYYVEAMFLL